MYHELNDKKFLSKMRTLSGEILQRLCHSLKEDYDIGANFYMVGSGARNLILQNGNEPVDLDYNLEILRCEDLHDCRHLKECVRKAFNKALQVHKLGDCNDSTVPLTSKQIYFTEGNPTRFQIDVCITARMNGNYYRMIHEKTGWVASDRYFWNQAPNSKELKKKVDYIKACGKWVLVKEQYLTIKNRYLTRNDKHHPSFICYAEAVNNVYNRRNHW